MEDDTTVPEGYQRGYDDVPVHAWMGIRIEQLKPNAVVSIDLTDNVRGHSQGTIHGGLLATLADAACAASLEGTYDISSHVPVTTDMHIRFYRQPQSGPMTAEAAVVHRGRRLLSAECSVVDGGGRMLARATATYMVVPRLHA